MVAEVAAARPVVYLLAVAAVEELAWGIEAVMALPEVLILAAVLVAAVRLALLQLLLLAQLVVLMVAGVEVALQQALEAQVKARQYTLFGPDHLGNSHLARK
jgi:hypothetical protein